MLHQLKHCRAVSVLRNYNGHVWGSASSERRSEGWFTRNNSASCALDDVSEGATEAVHVIIDHQDSHRRPCRFWGELC